MATEQEQTIIVSDLLQQRIDIYRPMLDISPDPSVIYDPQGRVTYINPIFTDVFGWHLDELFGRRLDFVPAECREETMAAIGLLLSTGKAPLLTTRRFTKQGDIIDVQSTATLFKDDEGQTLGSVIIIRNITAQKEMERVLHASEARYRTVLEGIEDGYYETDLDGTFTFMNEQLGEVMGYPHTELLGMNYRECTTPETAQQVTATFNQVLKTGEPVKGFVWEATGKDGRTRHLETYVLLRRDQEGTPIGFRGVGRDVTQRIQAAEALTEALVDQEQMASQLNTVAKISTAVSTILDPQKMFQAVVDHIRDSFGLYHAHVYLLNEAGDTLELVAGSGKVGRQMVEEKRQIPLSQEQSLVARAARSRAGVIVNDVQADPGFLPHPLLPETRAEMAVPMLMGTHVLGVIDIQANVVNRFTQRHVNIQTTLASQIAVALQNARLYAQAQQQTAELQETNERARTILDSVTTPMLISRAADGKILYANQLLADMVRVPLSTLLEQGTLDFYAHSEDRMTMVGQILEKGSVTNYELELKRADGDHFWSLLSARLFTYQGAPAIITTLIDITGRKQAQETIRENEALQRTIIDATPDWIFIKDREHRYQLVNKSYARAMGLSPATFIGKNDLDIGFPEELVKGNPEKGIVGFWEDDRAVMDSGQMKVIDVEPSIIGGETRYLNTIKVPLRDTQDQVWGILGFVHDVTDMKRAEEAIQHQADIEKLGRALSSNFLNLPANKLDEGIQNALAMLGEFTGVDRAYQFLFSPDGQTMTNTHEWCVAGIAPQIERLQALPAEALPYFTATMRRQEVFHVARVADLPAEAAAEKEEFEAEDIQSLIVVPIVSRGVTIGFIGFDSVRQEKQWSEADIGLLRLVSDILVSTLNRREAALAREEAIRALEAALVQSERLYEMSTKLNAITNVDQILEAAVLPAMGSEVQSANLFTIATNESGEPEWAELVAAWVNMPEGSTDQPAVYPVGTRFQLQDFPGTSAWMRNPDEAFLISDVEADPQLDEAARKIMKMTGIRAAATLPLRTRGSWTGLVNISWDHPQTFSDEDKRVYRSLAEQTAVMLNNQLLFEQSQKRAADMAVVAEVGTAITTIRDVDELLQQVVDLTKERFSLYHAHIYLLAPGSETLVLTSGAGKIGRQMVAQVRTIPLRQRQSLVARAARTRQGVIVNDVQADLGFLPHPLLPHTKSEMALPIIVGDEVLGVLDVQADQINRFNKEDAHIQATLAAQIGVALQNAQSFARSEAALQELEEITRRLRREGWESYLATSQGEGMAYGYDQKEITLLSPAVPQTKGSKKSKTNGAVTLAQPLLVQGEAVGQLMLTEPGALDDEATDIMTAVAERLSAHLENLRLTEQTQRALAETEEQAQRLALLNEISANLGDAATLSEVYDIAVTRTAELLKADRASLPLLRPDGESMEVVAVCGQEVDAPAGTVIPLSDTPMERAIKENRLIRGTTQGTLTSVRVAPLLVGGRAIGTLNVASNETDFFDERDESLMQQIVAMLSSVIENKRLLATAQARAERERRVRTIADKIRRGTDQETILRIAQQELKQLLGASKSAVQLGITGQTSTQTEAEDENKKT